MFIYVGSWALSQYSWFKRKPSDIDIWTDEENHPFKGDVSIIPTHILKLVETEDNIASLSSLYTIKCSHLGWDIFFEKHKQDLLLMKKNGAKLIPELYKALLTYWKEQHGNKDFLSLYKDKTQFFNDHVPYVYDHDYLHELIAYPNKPVYTKCLKEGEDVAIDKEKFNNLSFDEQVRMFREEIVVIAAERWLIPPNVYGKLSWIQAYNYSLRKTVTQLTKNWATEFLVMNLEHFITPKYKDFKHLFNTIKEGEHHMSNVDMKVFEEFKEWLGSEYGSMGNLIYCCCEGDIGVDTSELEYPKRNGRDYKDESYKQECEEYGKLRTELINKKWKESGFTYKHLEQEGGGEGGAEYCYGVFELNGKIYKAEYSYYSYEGYSYDYILDTLKEVKPVEKTITVYE